MTRLKIGIASYDEMKARTMAIARRTRPDRAQGNSRPGGAGPAAHAVAQGTLNRRLQFCSDMA